MIPKVMIRKGVDWGDVGVGNHRVIRAKKRNGCHWLNMQLFCLFAFFVSLVT